MTHHSRSGFPFLAFIAGAAVWALWGDKVKKRVNESKAWSELKREVRAETEDVKDLTREKYDEIVDQVVSRYAKVQGISKNEISDLVDDLKTHWKKIVAAWREE